MTAAVTHLTGRVWLYPRDPEPANVQGCVAVIADDAGSVVVDAGNSPSAGRAIQNAMEQAGLPPARYLVYTHHHWDHVWGGCAWQGVEIVAHEACKSLLEEEARRPWSDAYLRAEVEANPLLEPSFSARARAVTSWSDFTIVPPQRTFTDVLNLPGHVQLRHIGGRHAADSLVVAVPDSGVLLLGDCFYPPPYHLRQPDDGPDLAMVRSLLSDEFEWYVDSHDDPWRTGAPEPAG